MEQRVINYITKTLYLNFAAMGAYVLGLGFKIYWLSVAQPYGYHGGWKNKFCTQQIIHVIPDW